jgi:hypothetical protein
MKPPSPSSPPATNSHEFRESWLRAATMELRPYFASAGYNVPENIRFAIAFTSTGRKGNRKSESWHASSSADGNYEIFIRADIAGPVDVLALLTKELTHTALPDGAGHGKEFRDAAMKIGLLPPMRDARPAPHLVERLEKLAALLGPLPHDQLNIAGDPLIAVNPSKLAPVSLNGHRTQTSRMFKATCRAEGCTFLVRVAAEKVREIGPPHCPNHGAMAVDLPADEQGEVNGKAATGAAPQKSDAPLARPLHVNGDASNPAGESV